MPDSRNPKDLDRIDRNILRWLQRSGRMPITELAEKVGLSATPCAERVRRLERDGVIQGYHARINPEAVGRDLLVFVEITLSAKSAELFDAFRRDVLAIPAVLECHLVSGDFDYLIKARIRGMNQYRKLLGDMLLKLPGAATSKSYVVMEEIKDGGALPVDD